jgi:uncharacterized protein
MSLPEMSFNAPSGNLLETGRVAQSVSDLMPNQSPESRAPESRAPESRAPEPIVEMPDPFTRVRRPTIAASVLMAPIFAYQKYLSPLKAAPTCRFSPSCSSYALEALRVHGALRGSALAVARIAKCQPFHPGGFDPVPPAARTSLEVP